MATDLHALGRAADGNAGATLVGRLAAALRHWYRVARERLALAGLDERQLRDVGLTRHEAAREARRHFWD